MRLAILGIVTAFARVARADEPAPTEPQPAPTAALPDPEELAAQVDALATAQRRSNSRITALKEQVAPVMSLSRFITDKAAACFERVSAQAPPGADGAPGSAAVPELRIDLAARVRDRWSR